MNHFAKPIRVNVADDHTLVRAPIRALLEKFRDARKPAMAAGRIFDGEIPHG